MTQSDSHLPQTNHHGTGGDQQKELEEQGYRLRLFLEIISEADLLLLKKLVKQKGEAKTAEQKG